MLSKSGNSSLSKLRSYWRRDSGVVGAQHANTFEDDMQEEWGEWRYLVVDPKGIRPRADASYDKSTKRADLCVRYKEGAVVEVTRRRKSGWTYWLRIKDSEWWLFDVSPKDKTVRMVEAEVLNGEWQYESSALKRVTVLPHPSLSLAHQSGRPLKAGHAQLELDEVVSVMERVRPISAKGSFLRLADGRGWVLDFLNGQRLLQRVVQQDNSDSPVPSLCSSGQSSSIGTTDISRISSSDLGIPEFGEWEYVVLDPRGISLRSHPTSHKGQKTNHRVKEGQIVKVTERRTGDGVTFLHLSDPQGWAFDRQPGASSCVRMMEVTVERGLWFYIVIADKGVATRFRCSVSENAKCGKGPLMGSFIAVTQRVQVGDTMFLRLKDDGLWIFDSKNGRQLVDGPVDAETPVPGTTASVRADKENGLYLLSSPTNQKWALTKLLLLDNSQVHVLLTAECDGTKWALVSKPGSNVKGWLHYDRLTNYHSDLSASRPKPGFLEASQCLNA